MIVKQIKHCRYIMVVTKCDKTENKLINREEKKNIIPICNYIKFIIFL